MNDRRRQADRISANGNTEDHVKDWCSQRGAMALARRLQRYWHELSYPAARFWAEPIDERFAKVGTYELYRVACNLVNGLPPRYRDDPAGSLTGPRR
jgi:hypothetical protein